MIHGSLFLKQAKQVTKKGIIIDVDGARNMYEVKSNLAMTAQKVHLLQCELHKTHLTRSPRLSRHVYNLFDINNKIAELGGPINDSYMVDRLI